MTKAKDKAKAEALTILAKDIPKLAAAANILGSPLLCSILEHAQKEVEIELAKLEGAQASLAVGGVHGQSSPDR
ncbi:hypothetical protein LJR009_003233 [Bosea sp. LjRoot9]|uniref:hypothetical protein n=1 Tax=Bosea sp. LjRoot9 TaxID=3342341 RepID=UPI003ECF15FB